MLMKRHYVYLAAMVAAVSAGTRANAQQAVVLKATGVSNCAIGLPTPGVTGSPIALATDLNGHLCLIGGGGTSTSFTTAFPSAGMAIGVMDHTGMGMTHLKADASNNLSTILAGTLPAFASPPAVAQSGTWNVGLSGALPAFAAAPTFKIDQTEPGTTNLVAIGGTLPGFASPPAVAQSGTWNVGLSGALPAFASPPPVAQSGTWTVQPGNTANTTPWLSTIVQGGNAATVTASNALKIDGSATTQPVSAASLPLPAGAATAANQPSVSTQGGSLAGQTGTLAFARVENSTQAYTAGTMQPLRQTTAGDLLVTLSGSASNPVSALITNTSPIQIASVSSGAMIPTLTATTYAGNTSLGGLLTIPVFRGLTTVKSGTLSKIRIGFRGANQVPSLKVYVWETDPVVSGGATTCTNAAGFVAGADRWDKLVDIYSIVPSISTTTLMTSGSVDMATAVVNQNATTNLYVCVVTESSLPITATDQMTVNVRVAQD